MNILMVYQSVVDTMASFITLMIAVVEVDNTRMSRDSIYNRCPCHVTVSGINSSVTCGSEDSRSGISQSHRPTVSSSWRSIDIVLSSIPSGTTTM